MLKYVIVIAWDRVQYEIYIALIFLFLFSLHKGSKNNETKISELGKYRVSSGEKA